MIWQEIQIDANLQPLLSGRKREKLNDIMERTHTQIYLPYRCKNETSVYITGLASQVEAAKTELTNLANQTVPFKINHVAAKSNAAIRQHNSA